MSRDPTSVPFVLDRKRMSNFEDPLFVNLASHESASRTTSCDWCLGSSVRKHFIQTRPRLCRYCHHSRSSTCPSKTRVIMGSHWPGINTVLDLPYRVSRSDHTEIRTSSVLYPKAISSHSPASKPLARNAISTCFRSSASSSLCRFYAVAVMSLFDDEGMQTTRVPDSDQAFYLHDSARRHASQLHMAFSSQTQTSSLGFALES